MKKYMLCVAAIVAIVSCKPTTTEPDATGIFEADEVIVSAQGTGEILELNIAEGATLTAGQAIGRIDCTNLDLQKMQAQSSIEALQKKQNNATPQTEVTEQQITAQQRQIVVQREQLRVLEREHLRVQKLVKAEAVPTKQLDDIEGQIAILNKQIDATEGQIAVFRQQVASAKAQVGIQNTGILSEEAPMQMRVAQIKDQLNRCVITNPIAGTILTKYAVAHEVTTAGKALYKIADLSAVTLRAYISGVQLGQVKLGQTVKIRVDDGAGKYRDFSGTVTWISPKAEFTPKTIMTKDERANLVYAIKIRVKNDGFIKLGMYGEVVL